MSQPAAAVSRPRIPVVTGKPPSRPGVLDFLFVLCGCGISLLLVEWIGLHTESDEPAPAIVYSLLKLHPYMLFLPQGILLLWPLLFLTQKIGGREQPLSGGEWLWGLAWLASLAFAGWISWRYLGSLPEFLQVESFAKTLGRAYTIFVASTCAIA